MTDAGMTDIDWSKAPEGATHYNDSGDHYPWERRHGDALSYVGHDGEWHELSEGGKFEWPEAIPRPAQHRDWSDPAMWFDAPEWAGCVVSSNFHNGFFYAGSWGVDGKCETITGSSYQNDFVSFSRGNGWSLIATRPQPKEAAADLNDGAIHPIDAGIETVNHPQHYNQGAVECIDAMGAATVGKSGIEAICVSNVVKYLWRYECKSGVEDVKKAEWYLRKLLEHLNG